MAMDKVWDGIIYKASSERPAAQKEKCRIDNAAEVSGSNPTGLTGKTHEYCTATWLIEEH